MLLPNNRYELLIALPNGSASVEFYSELSPLYTSADDLRERLGELLDDFSDRQLALEALRSSLRAGEVLGFGASPEELAEYSNLRSQLSLLALVQARLFSLPRDVRLGDFAFSYVAPAEISRLINALRARISKYEGSGGVATVSKGERRQYPLAPRW